MLTPDEQREIEAEMPNYPDKQALTIDALKIVQKHRGWISDEALHDIAAFIGLPAADLDSVASFYNLIFRRPVGRHVIFVCDSVSCWIMGCDAVAERLREHGHDNGRFTLLPIVCLGACDHAPVVMVDDDLHLDVDPAGVDGILSRYP